MSGTITQSQTAAVVGRLALATIGSLVSTSGLSAVASLPNIHAAGTQGASASASVSAVLALAATGTASASANLAATATLPPLVASLRIQSLNVNTVYAVVRLPSLQGHGSVSASMALEGTGRLDLATQGSTEASQTAHAVSALSLHSAGVLTAQSTAYVTASLELSASLSILPPAPGYIADDDYYVAIATRPFYASLPSRPFYAAVKARSFYILSDPNMTPIFDTLDPSEKHVLTLDATQGLDSGETLTAINEITATQISGLTSTPPTLSGQLINAQPVSLTVSGKPVTVAAGHGVQVIVTGGGSGCKYLIAAVCQTSNPDKVLTLKGELPVSAA